MFLNTGAKIHKFREFFRFPMPPGKTPAFDLHLLIALLYKIKFAEAETADHLIEPESPEPPIGFRVAPPAEYRENPLAGEEYLVRGQQTTPSEFLNLLFNFFGLGAVFRIPCFLELQPLHFVADCAVFSFTRGFLRQERADHLPGGVVVETGNAGRGKYSEEYDHEHGGGHGVASPPTPNSMVP